MAAAGLGAFLVLAVGFTDGGYYGRAATALTLAFAAVAALGLLHGGSRLPSRAGLTVLAALVALTGWIALSSAWAVPGALVEGEVRRAVVYACALAALLLTVDGSRREPLLLGLLGGISLLGAVAIALRASSGEVVDRFYGTLLEEPVGYPNAMGALAALGITLAAGSPDGWRAAGSGARGQRGAPRARARAQRQPRSRARARGRPLPARRPARRAGRASRRRLRRVPPSSSAARAWAVAVRLDAGGLGLLGLVVVAALAGALVRLPERLATRRALLCVASVSVDRRRS